MGGFEDDYRDICSAVAYLTNKFGYVIDLVVGHSRGSVAAMRWVCLSEEGQGVRGFVNASGRYRMRVSVTRCICPLPIYLRSFSPAYLW